MLSPPSGNQGRLPTDSVWRIVAAEVRPAYRLWIRFADGVQGEVYLSSLIGEGVFSSWEHPPWFGRVVVDEECGTVV